MLCPLWEAIHAWLKLQQGYVLWPLSLDQEEGLCQLAAFLWLRHVMKPDSGPTANGYYQWQIRNHPDATYRVGFDAAHLLYVRLGSFVQTFRSMRQLS